MTDVDSLSTEAPPEEMTEALAAARRRLNYFEGFAPWIEEQMVTVVERAAEVAAEAEREHDRLAAEIERQRAESERLIEECDRLRIEANTIVAEANASAETVISEANTRSARMLAEAHQTAENMVNRLREEAAAIVSRAVGDLTSLDPTIETRDEAPDPIDAPPAWKSPEPLDGSPAWEAQGDRVESGESDADWTMGTEASSAEDSGSEALLADGDSLVPQAAESTEPAGDYGQAEPVDIEASSLPQNEVEAESVNGSAPASESKVVSQVDEGETTAEAGPFQWLRTALTGRDTSHHNGAEDDARDPAAGDATEAAASGSDPAPDDLFITRLTIHPAFTSDERAALQQTIEALTGMERVALGAVTEDFFELLITHQLFTSVLGSLLTAGGEHIRLIAQHDDSLEVEVTGLDWVRTGEGAAEVS